MNESCPFCNIDLNRTRMIDETDYHSVILINPALVKGHCLIIPRRHVERISELNKEEVLDLWQEIAKIERLIIKKYPGYGFDHGQHYRPFQKQSDLKVNHLHTHLLPRTLGDDLYRRCQVYETPIFRMLKSRELDEVQKFILNRRIADEYSRVFS